jgi:hypothetical protein
MADLYSVITGIEPDQQDIIEAELLAKQIVEANFPDMDLREGTAARDLVLRPAAFILALCKKGSDYYFAQNTLAGIDDTSSTEIVDSLLGNLFLERNTGSYAVINVRLYFARQKSVSLSTATSFSTDGSLTYFPATAMTLPQTALQYDSYQNEWYVDVDLVASEKGTDYNLSSGSLLYFSNFDPYFLHAEINYLSQSSTASETNTQFISRASTAISTRNLINKPSIDSILRQTFNTLNRVTSIGAGDTECYRDQVLIRGATTLIGTSLSCYFNSTATTVTVYLPGHSLFNSALVSIEETSGLFPLVILRAPITVVDSNTFTLPVPFSIPYRTLASCRVSSVDMDIYAHQGGAVDIFCAETVSSKVYQYTLDTNGVCQVIGPVYSISRSSVSGGSSEDTVATGVSFSVDNPYKLTQSCTIAVNTDGTLLVSASNLPVKVGRTVKLAGWPSISATQLVEVSSILSDTSFIAGKGFGSTVIGTGLTPTLSFVDPKHDVGFSERQALNVSFGALNAGKTVTLELGYFPQTESVQGYLDLSDSRVLCGDYLARGYDVYLLDITAVSYIAPAPGTGAIQLALDTYLKTLGAGSELILSDLVASLTSAGIEGLKTPLGVTYNYYSKDVIGHTSGVIVDVIKPISPTSIFLVNSVTTSLGTVS